MTALNPNFKNIGSDNMTVLYPNYKKKLGVTT